LTETEAELAQRSELEQALEAINESRHRRKDELALFEDQISEQESVQRQTQTTLSEWQSKAQELKKSAK